MNRRTIIIIIFLFIAVLAGLFFVNLGTKNYEVITEKVAESNFQVLDIEGIKINTEIVDSGEKMARGLGGRESLLEGEGMWFVFPEEGLPGIWMKDMKIPIDIVWFDKNMQIVTIIESVLPESYPKIFYPTLKSQFVLELPAGFTKSHGIKIGQSAKFIF